MSAAAWMKSSSMPKQIPAMAKLRKSAGALRRRANLMKRSRARPVQRVKSAQVLLKKSPQDLILGRFPALEVSVEFSDSPISELAVVNESTEPVRWMEGK